MNEWTQPGDVDVMCRSTGTNGIEEEEETTVDLVCRAVVLMRPDERQLELVYITQY